MSQQCSNGRLASTDGGAFRGGIGPASKKAGDQGISHEPVGRQFLLFAPALAGGALLQWNRLPGEGPRHYRGRRRSVFTSHISRFEHGNAASATIAARHDRTVEGVDAARRALGAEPAPVPVAAMTGAPG